MPFAYYSRLSPSRQAIYRRSDAVTSMPLPAAGELRPLVPRLQSALEDESRSEVRQACQEISDAVLLQLKAPPVYVVVADARPSDTGGELHGLYQPSEAPCRSRVTLWMRTARHENVVAFRTFLRTLIHELLHHLDYEVLQLPETFHTEGFYKRESHLFHQLMDTAERPDVTAV